MREPSGRLRALGAGYTFFVRTARLALPVVAVIIVGVVIARLSSDPQQNIADMRKDEKTTAGEVQLQGARYEGTDREGRAYTIAAEAASRVPEMPDSVSLTKPKADMVLNDGGWIAISSDNGIYDNAQQSLHLSSNVAVFHDNGHEMHLDDVAIDIKEHTAVSKKPVRGQSSIGQLTAAGMSITDGGDLIVFDGPATLTLTRLRGKKG
jgi:lipopolysaccharide export system protein LptC